MKTIFNEDLIPSHIEKVTEPVYRGSGNHSVSTLEEMIGQYKELAYQMRLREQKLCEITCVTIMDKPVFIYNQKVVFQQDIYFFKEFDDSGNALISNREDTTYSDYNDWWVSTSEISKYSI